MTSFSTWLTSASNACVSLLILNHSFEAQYPTSSAVSNFKRAAGVSLPPATSVAKISTFASMSTAERDGRSGRQRLPLPSSAIAAEFQALVEAMRVRQPKFDEGGRQAIAAPVRRSGHRLALEAE